MEIDKKILEKVKEFFSASPGVSEIYVGGDKLFYKHGDAESYTRDAAKVQCVKRNDVERSKQ